MIGQMLMTNENAVAALAGDTDAGTRRCISPRRVARMYAWLAFALLGTGCKTGPETATFSHSLGDLSSADRIEVTVEGVTKVATITDKQQVAAVVAFVGRYRDGWINVWSGGGAQRSVTFYKGPDPLRQFGVSARGINDGDYARPLSPVEVEELVGILGIEWPPPENPTGTPRRD